MGVRHRDLMNLATIDHSPLLFLLEMKQQYGGSLIWYAVNYMPNNKGMLRQPVFKGFRDDKEPQIVRCDCGWLLGR